MIRSGCVWLLLVVGCGPEAPSDTDTDVADTDTDAPVTDTAPPPDSWDNYAGEFFDTYCVQCHTGNGKDFQRYERVVPFADSIRCGVSADALSGCGAFPPPNQFPVGSGPFPDADERARLVAWIDDGMLEVAP